MIKELAINWMEAYGNSPTIYVRMSEMPALEDFRFQTKDLGSAGKLLWGESVKDSNIVSFFGVTKNQSGYGGASFDLIDVDGNPFTIWGPWSSRAGAMNNHFPHVVDVSMTAGPMYLREPSDPRSKLKIPTGNFTFGYSIKVEEVRKHLPADVKLIKIAKHGDDIFYLPHAVDGCHKGKCCEVCNAG